MDLWDYHLNFVKKYICKMPLTKSCDRDTCVGCKYAEKRLHPICDIQGCNDTSIRTVNDHGVLTYLCKVHYEQWRKSERKIKSDLKKVG